MTRALKILRGSEHFLRTDRYAISYKLVLCYSIHDYIHRTNCYVNLKQIMNNLLQNINDNNSFRTEYFSFLPLKEDQGSYVFIDHQKGCFPLIIIDEDSKKNISIYRKFAFVESLKELEEKGDEIYELLQKHKQWNRVLQVKIMKCCPDLHKS